MNQRIVLRRVRYGKISIYSRHFTAPQLYQLEGKIVEVRYDSENGDSVSIFRAGRYVCTAKYIRHLPLIVL